MSRKLRIAIIPIDNRPICYDLITDILSIDNNIELFIPDIKDLGALTTNANIDNIFKFIENLPEIDYLIASLDTLAYGGLVSSRRSNDSLEVIKNRILKFRELVLKTNAKVLAFSSIMRISNNNINEEEKEYWQDYGKMIFDWSFNYHKNGGNYNKTSENLPENIPVEIIKDYLKTRERNFEINKLYLKLAKEGFFNSLIFSKDDCAEFGFNILESQILKELIKKEKINQVLIKTGADEIPLSLISRALVDNNDKYKNKLSINPIFIEEESKNLISKYEDVSIKDCVLSQISIANIAVNNEACINLIINNFKKEQGDLVLGDIVNAISKESLEKLKIINKDSSDSINSKDVNNSKNAPYIIADVNNANGADCDFVNYLFSNNKINLDNFFGYCAYNTSANTIGCVLLIGIVKFLALNNNSFNQEAFKKISFIRFLDDWAYQAISRKFIRESAPYYKEALAKKINELSICSKKISKFLDFYPEQVEYSLPWDRSFEIRIKVN